MSTSRRARKSAAGYDLTHLMVGAEGTLGIIVELTLKLHIIPEAISAGVCHFPSIEAACEAAIFAIQTGLPIARMELLDDTQVRACNVYSKLALPERPMLFIEFHGSDVGVAEQAERFAQVASDHGSSPFEWATRTEDRSRLWKVRHDAFWATQSVRKGARVVATDVCVPISRLAECISETKRDIEASGLIAPIAGHVGDGNFHCGVAVMMENSQEVASAHAFIERLTERSLTMGGTCTGEHGIGQGKKQFLEAEHGHAAVEAMRAIKMALDPDDIMNPGKIL